MAEFVAIITAAGKGSRMQAECKKQFLLLQGKSILERTIANFLAMDLFSRLVVVLPSDEFEEAKKRLGQLFPSLEFVCGGELRQDSIWNALDLVGSAEFVFVHDGVRPFVSQTIVRELAEAVQSKKAVIPVVPSTNTLKLIESGKVRKTLDRAKIFGATTPQAFSFALLKDAYQKALQEGLEFTDDASLLESLGYDVYCIEDKMANIKITTPFDLLVAKAIVEES